MIGNSLCISRLYSGGLIVNFRCTSKCRHCLYGCSGSWPDDYITPEAAAATLGKVRSLGCHSLHIGGGEPFLHPEDLLAVLDVANERGVSIDYIETNSSWHKPGRKTRAFLKEIRARGVDTLLLSISPFHNEYIPFGRVKSLAKDCRSTGITVFPWIADFVGDLGRMDSESPHSLDKYRALFGPDYVEAAIRRYGLTERGRALELVRSYRTHYPAEIVVEKSPGGCIELENTTHFHVDLYGNYLPGLCSGLAIDQADLGSPLNPTRYPYLSALHDKGIGALYEKASRNYGFRPRTDGYMSKCDLCFAIRHHLVIDKGIDSSDLRPRDYYRYV